MPVIRIIFIVLGTISWMLGVVGIFLPLLPTTPFLLLAAFFYYRSSPKCYNWLLRQPILGKYIRDFKENRVIPLQAKIFSITLMWASMLYCVICLIGNIPVRIFLIFVAVAVTWHILSFKSKIE